MMGYFIGSSKISVLFFLKGNSKKNSPMEKNLKVSLLEDERMEMVVPKGCMAVYVGDDMRRFVIPTSYLCLPVFRELMERAAEEFGFEQAGGLRIPCEEEEFIALLKVLDASSRSEKTTERTKIARKSV